MQVCFFSFHHSPPYPVSPIPQQLSPLLYSPQPPRIFRALPMSALQLYSFPETRTFRSSAILPSDCHNAQNQSHAWRWMILQLPNWKSTEYMDFTWLLPLSMTTVCLVKEERKTPFFYLYWAEMFLHLQTFHSHWKSNQGWLQWPPSLTFTALALGAFLCFRMSWDGCRAACSGLNEISSA